MDDKFNQNMQEIFDVSGEIIESTPVIKSNTALTTVDVRPADAPDQKLNVDLYKDYESVRSNYEQIINQGMDAFDEIIEVAKNTQEPRAFEVVAILMKNISETNEKMIALQKQMRDMTKVEKAGSGTTIDKAIFIGSAADLNKMIKAKKLENDE